MRTQRTPFWVMACALVAGGALAAPSTHASQPAPRREAPSLSETWTSREGSALEELAQSLRVEVAAEEILVARKGRARGGRRGGARAKNRGGFSRGHERRARRGRDVDVDRRVDVDRNVRVDRDIDADDLDDAYTSDEEKAAAALVGGVIGIGIGKWISESEDPGYEAEASGY